MCLGDTVALGGTPTAVGGTAPYTYLWSPGTDLSSTTTANPLAYPLFTTAYTLQLTDANNCTSTSAVSVDVTVLSPAAFNFNSNGLQVDFIDQSSGLITGWLWDFGDGSTSTQQNPTHTFPANGQYIVCLTIFVGNCSTTGCIPLMVVVGVEDAIAIPGLQVAPNPFRGSTQVRFRMDEAAQVRMEAYDLQGKLIGIVADGFRDAGDQTIEFSASKFGASTGVYLLRLTVGERTETLRVQELR
ncbi:MAG: PKD domain-containing protein [Bacteroidia bacterium]